MSKVLVPIQKSDSKKQIAYGIVYAPNEVDAHGDTMTEEHIEQLAYSFLKQNNLTQRIDTNHDGKSNGSYPIESWIVKEGDPLFPDPKLIGAWALGVKVPNIEVWNLIETGKLNGFSFEAFARKNYKVMEVSGTAEFYGETDTMDGHSHFFVVVLNEKGNVVAGLTSVDMGHSHQIYSGTATAEADRHAHRFSLDEVKA